MPSWLVESSKATTLWGVSLFVNSLCSKWYKMDGHAMTLFSRSGDCATAVFLLARSGMTPGRKR
jgi:hypothetical protein